MSVEKIGKDSYKLYTSLINGGFTSGHAMGIVSQFINHCYMQDILREEQEAKNILEVKC